VDEVRKAKPDPAIAEYAVAESFGEIRAASGYEARGEAMANDLADGVTPEVVARFHKAILELRRTPNLARELHQRLAPFYGRVLPGLDGSVKGVRDGVYFVIGPEKQMAAWERYLKTVEGPEAKVFRLYPRDFWLER
jgi:hypothetical protein